MEFTNEELFIIKELVEIEIAQVIEMKKNYEDEDKKELQEHKVKLETILEKINNR